MSDTFRCITSAELMAMKFSEPPPEAIPTFADLAAIEPRLQALLDEARGICAVKGYVAGKVWYGYGGYPGLKPRLLDLVGWERPEAHPLLSTSAAYDVAYETIYEALPDDE